MTIGLVGTAVAAGVTVTATSAVVTVPAGSDGDFLLIGVSTGKVASTPNAPLITSASGLLSQVAFQHTFYNGAALFYRTVQPGDPTTYTFNITGAGAPIAVVCARRSGVAGIRNWNYLFNPRSSANTETSRTIPNLDGVQPTDLVVGFVSMGKSTSSSTQATALSTPSGWANDANATGPAGTAFHTATAMYSKLAATDIPAVTGTTGMYIGFAVCLIDASNPVDDLAGAQPSFVAAATAATVVTGATSLAVNKPAGVVDGDLILLAAANSAGTSLFTAPAGFIPLDQGSGWTGVIGTSTGVVDVDGQIWYKPAASEGSSYTVSVNASQEMVLACVAYRGQRTLAPVSFHAKTNTTSGGATTTSVAPAVLANVDPTDLVVDVFMFGADTSGAITITPPGGSWNARAAIKSAVADFNSAINVLDKPGAVDAPTSSSSIAGCWYVARLLIVGAPLPLRRRPGPNFRR